MRRKANGAIDQLLGSLRSLHVLVVHPQDSDGEELVRHIQRIGCQVQANWPPPSVLPAGTDVVFVAVRADVLSASLGWTDSDGVAVIAVIDYENPTILDTVMKLRALAVTGVPVRPFGLLTNLVVARKLQLEQRDLHQRIGKLERKLSGIRRIARAKSVLMESKGMTEEQAYKTIRDQAMAKRVTTEEIATAIINAKEILDLRA